MFNFLQKSSILMITSLFLIASCNNHGVPRNEGPELEFDDQLKDASVDFRQGWNDGCEVGADSGSNVFYKMFTDTNKADGWRMRDSAEYRIAWGNAYWYCYRDEYIDSKTGSFGAFFGGWQ